MRKHYRAFCLVCCGGGKVLTQGTKRECEREAVSHGNLYGHEVTLLEGTGDN
jgi:hypothetical protein